ncbi:MAG: ATPase inhibitor subunit zeta [Microvirga sp.]|nr:ATPase inhibitor subunit zeta [Microvirga sp.]
MLMSDFTEPGDEDVFRKVRGDLDPSVTDADIRLQMSSLLARAVQEVQSR